MEVQDEKKKDLCVGYSRAHREMALVAHGHFLVDCYP